MVGLTFFFFLVNWRAFLSRRPPSSQNTRPLIPMLHKHTSPLVVTHPLAEAPFRAPAASRSTIWALTFPFIYYHYICGSLFSQPLLINISILYFPCEAILLHASLAYLIPSPFVSKPPLLLPPSLLASLFPPVYKQPPFPPPTCVPPPCRPLHSILGCLISSTSRPFCCLPQGRPRRFLSPLTQFPLKFSLIASPKSYRDAPRGISRQSTRTKMIKSIRLVHSSPGRSLIDVV